MLRGMAGYAKERRRKNGQAGSRAEFPGWRLTKGKGFNMIQFKAE